MATWYGDGLPSARNFLKNLALPVFQKVWRFAFNSYWITFGINDKKQHGFAVRLLAHSPDNPLIQAHAVGRSRNTGLMIDLGIKAQCKPPLRLFGETPSSAHMRRKISREALPSLFSPSASGISAPSSLNKASMSDHRTFIMSRQTKLTFIKLTLYPKPTIPGGRRP